MMSPPPQGAVPIPPADPYRPPTIVVQPPPRRRFSTGLLVLVLIVSVAFNLLLFSAYHSYMGTGSAVIEKYYSGSAEAADKIALIQVNGEIMPPFTSRTLKAIEQAGKDDSVKGVVLVVDSPGGFVADSHEIYHELRKLSGEKHKPVYVSMRRLAASGGYYISMGGGPDGKIFAEPTTWTGSIGVLVPHYDISGLAEKLGVREDSMKTGKFKDSMTLFRPIREEDKKLWEPILEESLQRFIDVIVGSRKGLDAKQVRELATGQIFTATQAKEKKLIDEIGFLDAAIEALRKKLGLDQVRVVRYESPSMFWDTLIGSGESSQKTAPLEAVLDSAVPHAFYLFSTVPGVRSGGGVR